MATNQEDLLARIRRQQQLARIRAAQAASRGDGTATEQRRDPVDIPPEMPEEPAARPGPPMVDTARDERVAPVPEGGPGFSPLRRRRVDNLGDERIPPGQDPHLTPEANTRELQASREERRGGLLQRAGRGISAAFKFAKRAIPGGEPLLDHEPPVGPDGEPLEPPEPPSDELAPGVPRSEPDDFLSGLDRLVLTADDMLQQSALGVNEWAGRLSQGLAAVGPEERPQIASREEFEAGAPLLGRQPREERVADVRAGRELAREVYGEPETAAGLGANVATQFGLEGLTFMAPGLGAAKMLSQVPRAAAQATRGGRFLQLLASPQGFTQRAVQNFITGAPIDVVLSQASAEDSMAGAMAALTGAAELEEIQDDPLARAVFDVITGFGLGQVFGEALTHAQRARAGPRAEKLGRQAARAAELGEERPDLVMAIEALPDDLRGRALEGLADEQERIAAKVAEAEADVERVRQEALEGEEPARRGIRRRLSDIADPSRRQEDAARRQALQESFVDQRTGLRNADAFESAKSRLEEDPDTEIVTLDARNLHELNKVLGHEAGDRALAEVADAMRATGLDDRQLFRVGGDEFVVAAPRGQGEAIGRQVEEALGDIPIEGTEFSFGVRYGVGDDFRSADQAMQRAAAEDPRPSARPVETEAAPGVPRETAEPAPRAPEPEVAPGAPRAPEAPREAPEVREAQEAPEGPAREASEAPARPRSMDEAARGTIGEIAAREAAKPLGRAAVGAAAGAAVGVPSEEITPGTGALVGAAVALGLPGIARALDRATPGQGGFAYFPELQGRYFSQATVALDNPKAPDKAKGEAWMGFLRKQGVSKDELESIGRVLDRGEVSDDEALRLRLRQAQDKVMASEGGERPVNPGARAALDLWNAQAQREPDSPALTLLADLGNEGKISSEEAFAARQFVDQQEVELPKDSFTRDEVREVVQKHGLIARISETQRVGDDEPDLEVYEHDLELAREEVADLEARIEDYEPGGGHWEDVSLELANALRSWVDEIDDALDLGRRDADDLYEDLRTEAEALAEQGFEGSDVVEEVTRMVDERYDDAPRDLFRGDGVSDILDAAARFRGLADEVSWTTGQLERSRDEVYSLEQEIEGIRENAGPAFEQYTMDGGENYRETLTHIDMGQHGFVQEAHFPEKDIFVFARKKDRSTIDARDVLHTEEMQSDLHDLGRKGGYSTGQPPASWSVGELDMDLDSEFLARALLPKYLAERGITESAAPNRELLIEEFAASLRQGDVPADVDLTEWQVVLRDSKGRGRFFGRDERAVQQSMIRSGRKLAPDVPFKSSHNWMEVGIKRELWEAASEGMDYWTWASGVQAADNYNPARFGVTRIEYDEATEKLWAWKGDELAADGEVYRLDDEHSSRTLREALGKEVMEMLLEQPSSARQGIEWGVATSSVRSLDEIETVPFSTSLRPRIEGNLPDGGKVTVTRYEGELNLRISDQTYHWHPPKDIDVPADAEIEVTYIDNLRRYQLRLFGPRPGDPDGPLGVLVERELTTLSEAERVLAEEMKARIGYDPTGPHYLVETRDKPAGQLRQQHRFVNMDGVRELIDELDVPGPPVRRLEVEEGLQLNGHGHKKFYDVMMPNVVRKYLRSLDPEARIQALTLEDGKAVIDDEYVTVSARRPNEQVTSEQLAEWRELEHLPQRFSSQREPILALAARRFREMVWEEGLSGADAQARVIDDAGLFWTEDIQRIWNDIMLPDGALELPEYKPPPTNLGVEITPALRERILKEGQRIGYLHPALMRPLAGSVVGAAGGAAASDDLDVNPVLGAMIGAAIGGGIGLYGIRGGKVGPTARSRRAQETFTPSARPSETVRALAPHAQAGERLPDAGKFFDNPEAGSAELVSPVQIIDDLGGALDRAFQEAGLGLGTKTAVGGLTRGGRLRGALGQFKTRAQVFRQVDISDVPVFGHEAGHAMHKLFFGTTPKGSLRNADLEALGGPIRGELEELGKGISDGDLTEGWAEFWRRYLDNPGALERQAPKTLELVELRMKGFPELNSAWQLARADWRRYRESDSVSRVWSKISVGDREAPQLSLEDRWSRVRTSIIDDLEPVRRLVAAIEDEVGIEAWGERADDLARLVRGSVGSGKHFLENGAIDFKTNRKIGPGMKQILEPVLEDLDDFRVYMVSRRGQELHGRDKMTGLRNEDVDSAVERLEQKHGETFTEAFDQLQEWNESLLKYLRDSGVISKESYEAIRGLNQSYVPFYRVIEGGRVGGLGETYGHLFSPIKRIKGSGRDLVDPIESLAKNAMIYTQLAQKQQVSRALAALAEKEGVGKVLEKLGNPIKRSTVRLGEIEGQLEEVLPGAKELLEDARAKAKAAYEQATAGLDEDEIAAAGIVLEDPGEEILAFFRPGDLVGRRNTISVLVDGRRQYYEVDEELYAALEGLNREQLDAWARWVGLPARTLRAGATLAPEFLIRNPARDQVMAFIQSEYGYVPGVDLAKGVFELLRRGEMYEEWIRSGGYRAALTSLDRNSMQNAVRSMVEAGGVRNVIKHPFDVLQALSALMEDGTRMGEFLIARKQLGAFGEARGFRGRLQTAFQGQPGQVSKEVMQRAALSSREVSIDFARHGAKTASVRHLAAFWNARLQGYDRMGRAARRDPKAFAAKAFGIITLPSLLEYYANMDDPDYWEQPQWKRDLFWLIKVGDEFVAIPKPFELGVVFGTLPVRILDAAIGGPGGSHELRSSLEELVGGELGATLPFPTAVQPLIENYTNYSFFLRRPITPRGEEELSADLQAGPYTSDVARQLSRWTSDLPIAQDFIGSPRQIDNLLYGWTGGLGRIGTEAVDPLLEEGGPRVPLLQQPDVPQVGRRLTEFPGIRGVYEPQAGFSSESIQRFYERYSQARTARSDLNYLEQQTESPRYQEELQDAEANQLRSELSSLESAAADIASLRSQVDAIRNDPDMPSQEKRDRIDELGLEARRIAQSVLGRELPDGGGGGG